MIISNKSKQNFWSRLLLGMLAIFVLPATQELNYPAAVGNENYQNTQPQNTPQILTAVSLLQQQQFQPQQTLPAIEILSQNEPHFSRSPFIPHAPIRAGPVFI